MIKANTPQKVGNENNFERIKPLLQWVSLNSFICDECKNVATRKYGLMKHFKISLGSEND